MQLRTLAFVLAASTACSSASEPGEPAAPTELDASIDGRPSEPILDATPDRAEETSSPDDAALDAVTDVNDAVAESATDATTETAKSEYACSVLLGPNVAGEWFAAGFETQVDGARWQVKAPHHSFVEDWADPNHAVWKESGCVGTYYDCATKSKCAGGAMPDRVVFVTQTGNYLGTSQARWQELIGNAAKTIKSKYPGVKRIDLITFVRGPGGADCGNETKISPNLDAAHAALASGSSGAIGVGPRLEAQSCAQFSGPPHMNASGNQWIAKKLAEFYR
jgi:hypothetical protein